jgi:hypothetical protein
MDTSEGSGKGPKRPLAEEQVLKVSASFGAIVHFCFAV